MKRVLALLACLLAGACATTPPPSAVRPSSHHFDRPLETALGRLAARLAEPRAPRSGVLLVEGGADALRHRLALVRGAERAIDAQYYIWNSDVSGRLLAAALLEAADRGVRVRLLLDDMNVGGRDRALAALDRHPNIELRIFNPSAQRGGVARLLDLLGNLERLNRRMHNKLLLVDGAVALIGGRNIGDEYFDLHPEMNFRDRDVLLLGPALGPLASGFDGYWEHPYSVPVTTLWRAAGTLELERQRGAIEQQVAATVLPWPLLQDEPLQWLQGAFRQGLLWAPVQAIYERPGRPGADSAKQPLAARALVQQLQQAREEVLIESAYLVLREGARELLAGARARGVAVRALTNSLASNDVLPNHAGYARHRAAMLASGLELHELRPDAHACRAPPPGQAGCGDSARYGLHGKSAVFDRRHVFVGSFNLNPRSAYLNTESVVLVDSPELAAAISGSIGAFLEPRSSWRVSLDGSGGLAWGTEPPGRYEPEAGFWRALGSGLLSRLPYIDHL